jgi:two-component system, LytTR family, response regulator
MILRSVIIDDEENSSAALKGKLQGYVPEVRIEAICNNGIDGIKAIESLRPDIVFLDIEMPKMNGFSMLQEITYRDFELIFVTAYDHYAIKAIRFSALDYLVKPVEIEELKQAIERVMQIRLQQSSNQRLELLLENLGGKLQHPQRIAIPTSSGLELLKLERIVYLEASINYTHFFLQDGRKYTVSRTLKDFEELLPASIFIRIHNSYIINKNFAERYIRGEGGQVLLSNGIVLDISKRKKEAFLKALGY